MERDRWTYIPLRNTCNKDNIRVKLYYEFCIILEVLDSSPKPRRNGNTGGYTYYLHPFPSMFPKHNKCKIRVKLYKCSSLRGGEGGRWRDRWMYTPSR